MATDILIERYASAVSALLFTAGLHAPTGPWTAVSATGGPLIYGQPTTAQVLFCLDREWALFYAHQEEASIRLGENWDRFEERLRPFYASGRCRINPDGPWVTFIPTETIYRWQARVYGSNQTVPYAVIKAQAEFYRPASDSVSLVHHTTTIYLFMQGAFPAPGKPM